MAASCVEDGMKSLARDKTGTPLLSRMDYEEKAIERILRVPKGFMRNRTQGRVEELAAERDLPKITFELVEEGIGIGLEQMKEMIAGYNASASQPTPPREAVEAEYEKKKAEASAQVEAMQVAAEGVKEAGPLAAVAASAEPASAAPGVCPRAAEQAKAVAEAEVPATPPPSSAQAVPGVCPQAAERAEAEAASDGPRSALNEVSIMSELDKKRQGLLAADA